MADHQWVKHQVTPVNVLVDPEDDLVVAFPSPEVEDYCNENAIYGCLKCNTLLTDETGRQQCSAEDNTHITIA